MDTIKPSDYPAGGLRRVPRNEPTNSSELYTDRWGRAEALVSLPNFLRQTNFSTATEKPHSHRWSRTRNELIQLSR